MAIIAAVGATSCNRPTRFAKGALLNKLMPVTLPPGRLKLGTKPSWTGSMTAVKTIGIVVVAALAAISEGVPPDGDEHVDPQANEIGR